MSKQKTEYDKAEEYLHRLMEMNDFDEFKASTYDTIDYLITWSIIWVTACNMKLPIAFTDALDNVDNARRKKRIIDASWGERLYLDIAAKRFGEYVAYKTTLKGSKEAGMNLDV